MKKSVVAISLFSIMSLCAVSFAATEKVVPSIKIKVACTDECNVTKSIQNLLIASYSDKAETSGYKIDDSQSNELVITNFRARSATARILFGAMAGADTIEGYVKFPDGKQVEVKDMAITTYSGISDVARIVGEQAFEETIKIASSGSTDSNSTLSK